MLRRWPFDFTKTDISIRKYLPPRLVGDCHTPTLVKDTQDKAGTNQ
ncbi:MAG: hypothetical protein WBW61_05035 [Rhodanobacteraceae bacterium]